MTRFLEKEQKTQVNSNLIGVQVRPRSERVVNGIYVNYHYTLTVLTSYVDYVDKDGSYRSSDSGFGTLIIKVYDPQDPDAKIYAVYFYDGSSECDNNGDQYLKILSVPYADSYMWVKASSVQGDILYDLNWDETLQAYVASSRNDTFFTDIALSGLEVCNISDTQFIDTAGVKFNYLPVINPETQVLQSNYGYGLYNYGGGGRTEMYFQKTSILKNYGGNLYYYWDGEGSGYPVYYGTSQTGVGTKNITWDAVNTGDPVIYRIQNSTYNPMTVKSVDDEIVTEPLDCSVEYSVDGETWTLWPESLTDENNVICNIPRYMYLRFGQDVEITEE